MTQKYELNQIEVSIILPILNEKIYINQTIESILNQDYPSDKYELLIADGGSRDGTLDVIKSYSLRFPSIKLIHNPFTIVSSGFNIALNKSKGGIIIIMGGHSEIPKNYISKCSQLIKTNDLSIVGGITDTISNGIIGDNISIAQSSYFGVGNAKFRSKNIEKGCYVNTLAFAAYKRELFFIIGGFDEEMIKNQDDEFNYRAIQAGNKIWMDPSIKIKYYSRSNYKKLFIQYFYYGYYKVRVIQKRKQVVSIRHLIPAIFIFSLLITAYLGTITSKPLISLSIVFIYLVVNLLASIKVAQKFIYIPFISLAFFILHFSYGTGFIIGLFRFIRSWGDTTLLDNNFNKAVFSITHPNK